MNWFPKKVAQTLEPCTQHQHAEPLCQDGWIAVEDKVPAFGIRVLVVDPKYGMITARRTSNSATGHYWDLDAIDDPVGYSMYTRQAGSSKVTHWCPLPPAPTP